MIRLPGDPEAAAQPDAAARVSRVAGKDIRPAALATHFVVRRLPIMAFS
jgi:hypothetical protein